jgi:hypothetical protein
MWFQLPKEGPFPASMRFIWVIRNYVAQNPPSPRQMRMSFSCETPGDDISESMVPEQPVRSPDQTGVLAFRSLKLLLDVQFVGQTDTASTSTYVLRCFSNEKWLSQYASFLGRVFGGEGFSNFVRMGSIPIGACV